MSAAKHAPGPWFVGEMRHKYDIVIRDAQSGPVALCTVAGYPGAQAEANARLIAAAPDLLAALEQIERMDGTCNWWEYQEIARAAIAKAKGSAQ